MNSFILQIRRLKLRAANAPAQGKQLCLSVFHSVSELAQAQKATRGISGLLLDFLFYDANLREDGNLFILPALESSLGTFNALGPAWAQGHRPPHTSQPGTRKGKIWTRKDEP